MTDREALAAALEYYEDGGADPNDSYNGLVTVLKAARERLAQLPEKCEHGESKLHKFKVQGDREVPSRLETCPGNVYPADLVERLKAFKFIVTETRAVAVLDALNETP